MVSRDSNLYPPFTPTVHEQVEYEKTAQRLLDSTVQHYQLFNFHYHREMNRKRWKPVKSREYMTVYKERNPLPMEQCDVGSDWKDPKLLVATGTIVGQLDEVMYGVVTPDAESMLLKASITKNRLVGGAVLTQIHGPTIREPFRFLGVKWFVMAPPTTLNGMIWARDAVFIESTGITTLPNGDRIGYQLMQSVDIPGYGELDPQHSIVRGRISSCSIFKQLGNGTVDVYVRGYVEAFGKVMDTVALKTVASGFLSSWNSVGCAQYKKLMWCIQHPLCRRSSSEYDDGPDYTASINGAGLTHNHRCCASCNKRFGTFSSAEMCILCKQWMCSKCRVVSKVRRVDNELRLDATDATICKACVEHVDELDTFKIATQEIRSGRFAPKRSPPMIKLWSFRGRRNSGDGRRDSSILLQADRNAGFSVDRSAATSSSEGVQLFDPTQLYNSSKSHDHSSDAEEHDDAAAIAAVASTTAAAHGSDYYFDHYPRRSRSPDLTPSEYEDEADDEYEHFAGKLNYVPRHFQTFGASTIDNDDVYSDDQITDLEPCVASPVPSPPSRNPPNVAEDFLKQLQTLRAATEQTYQMTLQTTSTHIQRQTSRKTVLYP
uniref:FYVE-type domain-containing protein n=1 Tax=Globisporangium ultimum (strain ATCC 200006 / CBS 805.95 / DAOM BR144) TaxID=431595 RepID=K3WF79_GLOUD